MVDGRVGAGAMNRMGNYEMALRMVVAMSSTSASVTYGPAGMHNPHENRESDTPLI